MVSLSAHGEPPYLDQEVPCSYGYFSGYTAPRKIEDQVRTLKTLFPELEERILPAYEEKKLPDGAEGYFAIPRFETLGATYVEALKKVLNTIKETREGYFKNWREGRLSPENLRHTEKTAKSWERIFGEQKGDLAVVPAQFGRKHCGRSPLRARFMMGEHEFGLGAYEVGIMLLTHPKRLNTYEDLWIDCAGDEFDDPKHHDRGSYWGRVPVFRFSHGVLRFGTRWAADTDNTGRGGYGTSSAWDA